MGMLDQASREESGAAILPVGGVVESEEQRKGGVEKPGGFFNEHGAPGPGASVEKPTGFFNKQERVGGGQPAVGREEEGHHPGPEDIQLPGLRLPEAAPAVARGGRSSVLTPAVQEQLCMLLSIGLSRRQAAAYLDIDHTTISHAAGRDEDFARGLRRAEELSEVQPMMSLVAASRKNWRAAAWFLNYKKKHPTERTDEQMEELQQNQLASVRRTVEVMHEYSIQRDLNREADEARRLEKERAKSQAEVDAMFPRRKKRAKENP